MEIAARTVFAEARGQSKEEQEGIAWSIVNRWRAQKWFSAHSLAGTCFKPMQYSSWNTTNPNRMAAIEADTNDPILGNCRSVVLNAVLGRTQDPTGGATHYYSTILPEAPEWATLDRFTKQIGKTKFYANVP